MKKLHFLVALTTNDNDYQIEQAQSAQQMARKLGAEVQIVYADNDAITQSTQILKAIQVAEDKRPDAVVFEPVGGTALPQVARAAASVGIGWAVLNRDASYIPEMRKSSSAPIFGVSSDHLEIGRIQGRQFAALLPHGGAILYIQGPAENSAAKERALGMQANESERERWLKLPFTGCDGLPKTGEAWVRSGLLAATVFVPPNTGQAIEMIFQAIQNGKKAPERALTVPVSIPALDELKKR